jgi:hypothetical protein
LLRSVTEKTGGSLSLFPFSDDNFLKLKDPRACAIRSAASGFSQITKSYGRSIMLLNLKYPSLLIIVLDNNNNNNNKQIKAFKPEDICLHKFVVKEMMLWYSKNKTFSDWLWSKKFYINNIIKQDFLYQMP